MKGGNERNCEKKEIENPTNYKKTPKKKIVVVCASTR
jgi:hypothetical protein